MISRAVTNILQEIPLRVYINEARTAGRKSVPKERRLEYCAALERVNALYAGGANRADEQYLWNLIADILAAERSLIELPKPRYRSYTNIAILNRFIGVYSYLPVDQTWARCRLALAVLVRDWINYEQEAIDAFNLKPGRAETTSVGTGFSIEHVKDRILGLRLLNNFLAGVETPGLHPFQHFPGHRHKTDWEHYAVDHGGIPALAHLSALPQSKYHDEYLFLRSIHITEVCLWAIITAVRVLAEAYSEKEYDVGLRALQEANFFADFLVRTFNVFKTMPIESFADGFRDDTGNASAIQSEKYQQLEIMTRGVSDVKRTAFKDHNELAWLQNWNPANSSTLIGLRDLIASDPDPRAAHVISEMFRLDRNLRSWRNIHLGIAKDYLRDDTVGTGLQGVPYLRSSLAEPALFDEPAVQRFKDSLPVRPMLRVKEPFGDINIGIIIAENVAGPKLVDYSIGYSEQVLEKIRTSSKDGSYYLRPLFRYYDSVFSKFGEAFPLKRQLQRVLEQGWPKDPVARLLLSLELSSGVLMGIHDGSGISFPIRVTTACQNQQFESTRGPIALTPDELIFADQRRVFASYVHGPDKRTLVRATGQESQVFRLLVFMVMGAPGLPVGDFDAAMTAVQTAVFSIAGEPRVYSFRTDA